MLQGPYLRDDGLLPDIVGVAQAVNGDAGPQIDILFSGFIIGNCALSFHDLKRETGVGVCNIGAVVCFNVRHNCLLPGTSCRCLHPLKSQ